MNIIDWILVIITVIITSLQTYRGSKDMDLVLFEMVAFIGAANLSLRLLSSVVNLSNLNSALVLIILFVFISLIFLIVAGFIAKYLQFSLAPVDTWLSFLYGLITSWAILYILLRSVMLAFPAGAELKIPIFEKWIPIHGMVVNSTIAREILDFGSFKSVWAFLNKVSIW